MSARNCIYAKKENLYLKSFTMYLNSNEGFFMKKNETKLLASRAVNKIGNVMYDYGNSAWTSGSGDCIGKSYF